MNRRSDHPGVQDDGPISGVVAVFSSQLPPTTPWGCNCEEKIAIDAPAEAGVLHNCNGGRTVDGTTSSPAVVSALYGHHGGPYPSLDTLAHHSRSPVNVSVGADRAGRVQASRRRANQGRRASRCKRRCHGKDVYSHDGHTEGHSTLSSSRPWRRTSNRRRPWISPPAGRAPLPHPSTIMADQDPPPGGNGQPPTST